jgi:hypothetical protein
MGSSCYCSAFPSLSGKDGAALSLTFRDAQRLTQVRI